MNIISKNNSSNFVTNIEKYKNNFDNLLNVNEEPLSSFRREFALYLQKNYWMTAKDAFSCFEDFIYNVTIYNVMDVDTMLELMLNSEDKNRSMKQLIIPFLSQSQAREYKLRIRGEISGAVSRHFDNIKATKSGSTDPIGDLNVRNFYSYITNFILLLENMGTRCINQ